MNFRERIINGLYGCAVADAVGNPFEFQTNINPNGVVTYANFAEKLVISDDTQMSLFGFQAIRNMSAYDGTIEKQVENSFTDEYIDWHYTQTLGERLDCILHKDGLLEFREMYSVQSPGNTCLDSLETIENGGTVVNDSMGCGSVMRLLPLVTLLDEKYDLTLERVIKLAQITGTITHKHKDNDAAIRRYMIAASNVINESPVWMKNASHISELGEGWIAPECVEMAIWAYCKAATFDQLLELSIAHGGDSDSVAAVAGSLWGLSGKEVPQKYIRKLDAIDAIDYISNIN